MTDEIAITTNDWLNLTEVEIYGYEGIHFPSLRVLFGTVTFFHFF